MFLSVVLSPAPVLRLVLLLPLVVVLCCRSAHCFCLCCGVVSVAAVCCVASFAVLLHCSLLWRLFSQLSLPLLLSLALRCCSWRVVVVVALVLSLVFSLLWLAALLASH